MTVVTSEMTSRALTFFAVLVHDPHTELGYSVGHWVGDVLTMETPRMMATVE